MADTYCINCKEKTEQTHFVETGSEDYQECKKCGNVISHDFEMGYYYGLKEKEQYANAQVLKELENIDTKSYEMGMTYDEYIEARIKELKEVKP
jgi:hypothetical protein